MKMLSERCRLSLRSVGTVGRSFTVSVELVVVVVVVVRSLLCVAPTAITTLLPTDVAVSLVVARRAPALERAAVAAANNVYANQSHFSRRATRSPTRQSSARYLTVNGGRSHDSTRVDLFIINL